MRATTSLRAPARNTTLSRSRMRQSLSLHNGVRRLSNRARGRSGIAPDAVFEPMRASPARPSDPATRRGAPMRELRLSKAFTLLESGPVVLVTTHDGPKDNIMTISWTMVMDFTPRFAITTGEWNHSFAALRKNRECVIAIPTVDLLDKVVGIGTCSGSDTDKCAK